MTISTTAIRHGACSTSRRLNIIQSTRSFIHITHFRYNYTKYIGGILLITLADFAHVDGMSNRYWGWGMEDDEFYVRLVEARLPVYRPTNLTTNASNTFTHIHDRRVRQRDVARLGEQRRQNRRRDRISGVSTVHFDVLSRTQVAVDDAPSVTVVNVQVCLCLIKEFSRSCTAIIRGRRGVPMPGLDHMLPC